MSEQRIKDAISLMDDMIDDSSVPKNIRKVVGDARAHLSSDKEEVNTRISSAVQSLVGVSEDINMPMHTRTQVWTILSALESIQQ